jgi:hypothetical protein
MKKLGLFVAAFFSCAYLFAQNTNVISQTGGNGNTGNVTQISAGQSNYAEILTVGSGNDGTIFQNSSQFGGSGLNASIQQNGDENHALIDQGRSNVTFGHVATIDQDGGYNSAEILQVDGQPSTAYTRQLGDLNVANQLIYSDGQGNSSAYIWQEGNGNNAYQNLGEGNFVGGSTFSATQVGSGNIADQRIYSDEQFQLGGSLQTINNHGTIVTYGSGSIAVQIMDLYLGKNANNTAVITQTGGDYNDARQYQNGDMNTSTITQTGSLNVALSTQTH